MGAPIRRALQSLQSGQGKPSDSCEIPYRADEKYWVVASKSEVTVSYGLHFDNSTDRALARIFLLVRIKQNDQSASALTCIGIP